MEHRASVHNRCSLGGHISIRFWSHLDALRAGISLGLFACLYDELAFPFDELAFPLVLL